ncbi:hypothetical protein KUCAC02_033323, partial [Chaenocephalus aceratus]
GRGRCCVLSREKWNRLQTAGGGGSGAGVVVAFLSREKWNRLQTAGGGGRSVPDKASTLSLYRIRGRGRCCVLSREKWNRLQTAGGGGRSVPDKASTLSLYRIRGRGCCCVFARDKWSSSVPPNAGAGVVVAFLSREKWNRLQTAGGGGRSVPDKASTLSLYRI